jgi:hypothetical protein
MTTKTRLTALALAAAALTTAAMLDGSASARPSTSTGVVQTTGPVRVHPAQECLEFGGRKWLCTPPEPLEKVLKTLLPGN